MTRMMGEIAIAISGSLALSLIVKATIVCGGTLMALCIAKRSRAAVRHVLLSTAFLVLLALPLASLTVPPRDVSLPIHSSDSTVLPVTLPLPDGIPLPSAESGDSAPTIAARTAPSASTVLFAAWMAGVTYFLAMMSLGLRRARRARRNGSPWPEGQAAVSSVAAAPQLRRRIQLLLNDAVTGPVTCGVLRPAIVLPPDARGWPPEDLRRALVHELEHVRRGDWLVLCLARIVCAFYWFHPLVWMSLRQLRLEAERACDDAVLRTADAEEYADQLLTLAERVVAGRTPAVLAMASRGELAARVSAVLDEYQSRGAAG